jgi:hypothetical protein
MNQQVIGTISGLEQRAQGWVAVAISEPGKEWPLKLSTKRTELIQQAQQMMGQLVTAGYNESESQNINPHNGQPFTNRYLEAIALGSVDLVGMPTTLQPQQFMPQPSQTFTPQPQAQPLRDVAGREIQSVQPTPSPAPLPQAVIDHREIKIHRQTATKVAVRMLPFLKPEEQNLTSVIHLSEQLVKYYAEGVVWTVEPVSGITSGNTGQQRHTDPTDGDHDFVAQPGDDDIPF